MGMATTEEAAWADLAAAREEIARLRFVLSGVDHTLSVHGHIDADTPLHEVVRAALAGGAPDAG